MKRFGPFRFAVRDYAGVVREDRIATSSRLDLELDPATDNRESVKLVAKMRGRRRKASKGERSEKS